MQLILPVCGSIAENLICIEKASEHTLKALYMTWPMI